LKRSLSAWRECQCAAAAIFDELVPLEQAGIREAGE
jgi:hypothetical protein